MSRKEKKILKFWKKDIRKATGLKRKDFKKKDFVSCAAGLSKEMYMEWWEENVGSVKDLEDFVRKRAENGRGVNTRGDDR